MKTIAMTGASGFIGKHLLRHYLTSATVPSHRKQNTYSYT